MKDDYVPNRATWNQILGAIPADIRIIRFGETDDDSLFEVDLWVPKPLSAMLALLSQLPADSRVEKIIDEVGDDEVMFTIEIPKPEVPK